MDIIYEHQLNGNDASLWSDDSYWEKGIKWGQLKDMINEENINENITFIKHYASSIFNEEAKYYDNNSSYVSTSGIKSRTYSEQFRKEVVFDEKKLKLKKYKNLSALVNGIQDKLCSPNYLYKGSTYSPNEIIATGLLSLAEMFPPTNQLNHSDLDEKTCFYSSYKARKLIFSVFVVLPEQVIFFCNIYL